MTKVSECAIITASPTRRIVDSNSRQLILEENGSVPVTLQDITSETINLFVSEFRSNFILTSPANRDELSVSGDVDPGYLLGAFIPGDIVCIKAGANFYQGGILSVTDNGNDNWTIDLDIPLDTSFVVGEGCSIRQTDMAVDGSVTPRIFSVSPALLDAGIKWDITRTLVSFLGTGDTPANISPDDSGFGTQGAIINGVVWRTTSGVNRWKNLMNAKTNSDLKLEMFDVPPYTAANRLGLFGVNCRRTWAGTDKSGVVLRLENNIIPADAGRFQTIISDNLTDHELIRQKLQGHVVTEVPSE
jgi:hypothetical protein